MTCKGALIESSCIRKSLYLFEIVLYLLKARGRASQSAAVDYNEKVFFQYDRVFYTPVYEQEGVPMKAAKIELIF